MILAKQRLIDAIRFSRIIKEYRNEFPQRTARQKVCNDILSMLGDETQTPTADAVVRCWECRHCDPDNKHCDHYMGTGLPFPRKENDFCSYGERIGGAE